jgi:tetratricopeptide (TPR) repeat protein
VELTLKEALKKGFEAYKAGQLQEADKIYTAILQKQPNHPEANHNMGVLAVAAGEFQEALPLLKNAIEASPNTSQFWLSYINTLINLDRLADAKGVLDQGKNNSDFAVAYNNLGIALKNKGDLEAALDSYKQALKLKPDFAVANNNLGVALKDKGDLEAAIDSYKQALKIKSDYAEANYNMGIALQEQGNLEAAIHNYKQALKTKSDYAEAYYNMGIALEVKGDLEAAIDNYKQVLKSKPDNAGAKMNLDSATKRAVPAWHLSMMKDKTRNKAYLDALKLAIDENDCVLEIGTGSGLLSMMAAEIGAKNIVTCESSKTIATVAKEIIHKNGFGREISVINKKSTELIVGKDLPRKADLVISEILSAEFVGEGVRSTILDANKRLLNDNGKMIPESGDIRIALLGSSAEIRDKVSVGNVNGFDLSSFNSISGRKFSINLNEKPVLLSSPKDAFKIDLYDVRKVEKEEKNVCLKANESGLCLGVVQWLRVQLFKDIEYENNPVEIASHWPTPIYLFDNPVEVAAGQVLEIRAALFENAVWFDLKA